MLPFPSRELFVDEALLDRDFAPLRIGGVFDNERFLRLGGEADLDLDFDLE